ncbi:glycosyltransferase involved in cell wall biosynthesis [Flavobacteriaceae bacterium MAR_2010_72]|nr:glycosyltransferase involved in cell wall biosynthesis [Flavobacteriaceae bacterium MAR_2010_72]
MSPVLSVVMATYNGERYIREAIQSVLDQSFADFEFIIVDDGSVDETAAIIASFDDARIVYIKKATNTGIADSLNLGISTSKGIYIARMDDDDICMPDRFEAQLKVFEHHQDVILCATDVLQNDPSTGVQAQVSHDELVMALLFYNPIIHPTVMLKRGVLGQDPYDPSKVPSEDYELWSRLIWEGRFYKLNRPLLDYRSHANSETSRRRKEQLKLNVAIAEYMFDRIGFRAYHDPGANLKRLVVHDYTISGRDLKHLMRWCVTLKRVNQTHNKFDITTFNAVVDKQIRLFLISYFMNQKIKSKMIPFFSLSLSHKAVIVKHYLGKVIKRIG